MALIQSNKTASKQQISAGETFDVTLSLHSEPNISENPQDVVLLLDHSGSMNGQPLASLKTAVCNFLDILDESTDGKKDNIIGNGSHVGVVSFGSTAKIEKPLSSSVPELKATVNAIISEGTTNHKDAFQKGIDTFDKSSPNEKVLVMFTDGNSNSGSEGFDVAEQAKAQGITIYCLGYSNAGQLDEAALNRWASSPAAEHVLIAPDYNDIKRMFETLAEAVSQPKATDIVLKDIVNPCFEIISFQPATKGSVTLLDKHTIQWNLASLGATKAETEYMTFTVQNTGDCSGIVNVDRTFEYTDAEGNTVQLPNPTVEILSANTEIAEAPPVEAELTIGGCVDSVEFNAGDVQMTSLGRILQLSATVKNICPNKRAALAVILSELDAAGAEHPRGMKTFLIPAHMGSTCKDVTVKCIKFVLPEELDTGGNTTSICNERNLRVRMFANYIDTDYTVCDITI